MAVFVASSRRPLHLQVSQKIRDMIAAKYGPGDILPTYRQLAEQLGVGVVTVRRAMGVLAARGIVSPIRRKGTVVNRKIEAGEVKLSQVALIIRSSVTQLFRRGHLTEMTDAIFSYLEPLGTEFRIVSLLRSGGVLPPAEVAEAGVDGALLVGVTDNSYIAQYAQVDVPLVVVDHFVKDTALDYVVCDNPGAARDIVGHLVKLGHRKLAYLTTSRMFSLGGKESKMPLWEESDAVERRECVQAEIASAGLPPAAQCAFDKDGGDESRAAVAKELVQACRRDGVTAIVTDDEGTAIHLMACLGKMNVRVPGELSLAALAAGPNAQDLIPGLTHCRMDFRDMGLKAVRLLEERNRSPRPTQANIVRIGYTMLPGTTSAAPAN